MSLVPSIDCHGPETQIADTVAELSAAAFTQGLRAVVLTGSLSRGEGTWFHEQSRDRLAGDAEFLLIFEQRAGFPSRESIARLTDEIEARLREAGVDADIGLSPVRPNYLLSLCPHIFAYE